jgi:hypothetical protein
MLEKRRFPRYDKEVEVRYSTGGIASVESTSLTKNISRSGIRMPVSRLLKKGDQLRLTLSAPSRDSSHIYATGRIAWTREAGQFELDAGLEFTKIDPRDSERLVMVA